MYYSFKNIFLLQNIFNCIEMIVLLAHFASNCLKDIHKKTYT